MQHDEFKIHKACVDYLKQRVWKGNKLVHEGRPAFESLLIIHIANQVQDGSDEAATIGFFLKQMGVEPGAYDFLFFWPHRQGLAYDVKEPKKGKLSPAQIRFRHKWENIGYPSAWGTSVKHMRDTLIKHGAKCRIFDLIEPDLRTDKEKKDDAFNFCKPIIIDDKL